MKRKTLDTQRAEMIERAKEYQGKLAKGVTLDDSETENLKSVLASIDEIDVQISKAKEDAALLAQIEGLNVGADDEGSKSVNVADAADGDNVKASSVGAYFVKSLQAKGRSLKDSGQFVAPEFKAATDTQLVGSAGGPYGPLVTDVDRQFAMPYQRPLVVADLLGAGTVGGNAITYPVFGALEGEAGFVAEAGKKPQVHVADPEWVTDKLGEVAAWFKISDDMAEDLDYVMSEINSAAAYDLRLKEELAILSGAESGPQFAGILNRKGIQDLAAGSDSDPDAIFKAISNVQLKTGQTADGIVINPTDYTRIRLSKDANGQYFGGGFFAGQYGQNGIVAQPPLWGLKTVVTASIPAGTVLAGAFKYGGKIFRKGGLRVDSTNSHEADFTSDQITVRVKERLGLQVKYPAAFVKVTLSGEKAVISK